MFIPELDASPQSNLDYGFDYSDWLATGATIVSSSWVITPSATLSNDQNAANICTVFVTGITVGNLYYLANTIETSDGRTDTRTIVISCKLL